MNYWLLCVFHFLIELIYNLFVVGSPLPHTSASALSANREHFLFAFAYDTGSILLFKMNAVTGRVSCVELKQHYDTLVPKFLSRALR